jgi:hypothetical protein
MGIPEPTLLTRAFSENRGTPRDVAARQRTVAKHVAEAITKLVAHGGDPIIGSPAVRTGVAAILHQLDPGLGWTETVVPTRIDGWRQPIREGSWCSQMKLGMGERLGSRKHE